VETTGERLTTLPDTITPHQLVKKVYADRAAMGRGEISVDWGMGEHMAFASLVASGYPVRLSGEDCGRGTFTHRHAVIHDQNREKFDEGTYTPLQNVAEGQAPFVVIDSILSEEAVLAFEYGYASNDPNTLVIWEAQFGDFANGAQVVIDQFIASGEVKWGRVNGITLMLPHGYEGQGPGAQLGPAGALHATERRHQYASGAAHHSQPDFPHSAPSDGAQSAQAAHHHDAQVAAYGPRTRRRRCPSSPKAASRPSFPRTRKRSSRADKVKRVVVCSGKVYYDLVKKRDENASTTRPFCAWSSCTRFRTRRLRPNSRSTPTRWMWCGARTSRKTRVPGFLCSTTSTRTCSMGRSWVTPAALRQPRQRLATRNCIRSSKRRWSKARLPSSKALC
jgi:2-oxoglutarate dehydrogenase E1 component